MSAAATGVAAVPAGGYSPNYNRRVFGGIDIVKGIKHSHAGRMGIKLRYDEKGLEAANKYLNKTGDKFLEDKDRS